MSRLHRRGVGTVLGLNRRNLDLVRVLNPPAAIRRADDKLVTKAAMAAAGVRVAATLAAIRDRRDVRSLDWSALPEGFVLKPVRGARGAGILVVKPGDDGGRRGGRVVDDGALRRHALGLLDRDGRGGAFVEMLLSSSQVIPGAGGHGLADVRVLVVEGRARQAMLRLPTAQSGGRANLHQGAVGVGVDVSSGRTAGAVHGGRVVTAHPDSGVELGGRVIGDWQLVVEVAVRAAIASELGYAGIDVAIDDRLGPVVLEVNARPGLAIQLANRRGLLDGGT
ncbi:MAG: sugar-transfer associated ATP-grasp domain-containing protein [Acidimicrobiales bacterium]